MANSPESPCPICDGGGMRREFLKGGLHLVQCGGCGFVRQDPVPERAALKGEYGAEDHYMQEILHTEATFLERDRSALAGLAQRGASGPLLDVGAGAGTLLRAAIERGWKAVGLELSHPSAEHMRRTLGVTVHECFLEEAPLLEGTFGVVTFSHSLEHVPDPVDSLRRAARVLRPGGFVLVAVPNWAAAKRLAVGLRLPWIYPHHISYFTRKTLAGALERAGLAPVHFSFHPFLGVDYPFALAFFQAFGVEPAIKRFLRMGERNLGELIGNDVQLRCPPWRFRLVHRLARILLRCWPERLLARVGRSEELRAVASRKDAGRGEK